MLPPCGLERSFGVSGDMSQRRGRPPVRLQLHGRHGEKFVARKPVMVNRRLVDGEKGAGLDVADPHRLRIVFEQLSVPALGVLQAALRTLAGGDVAKLLENPAGELPVGDGESPRPRTSRRGDRQPSADAARRLPWRHRTARPGWRRPSRRPGTPSSDRSTAAMPHCPSDPAIGIDRPHAMGRAAEQIIKNGQNGRSGIISMQRKTPFPDKRREEPQAGQRRINSGHLVLPVKNQFAAIMAE